MTCGAWLMLSMPPVRTMSGLAELDHLRAADRRLDAGAAQPIHGQRRHVDRHAGLERHVARAVDRVGARLQHVAERRRDRSSPAARRSSRRRRARGDRAELERRHVLQRADVVGHRRARAADDEHFRFRHRSLCLDRHERAKIARVISLRVGVQSRRGYVVTYLLRCSRRSLACRAARRCPTCPGCVTARGRPLRSRRLRGSSPRYSSISAADSNRAHRIRDVLPGERRRRAVHRLEHRRPARDACCPTRPCPSPPCSAAPRSVTMSPNRLLVTMTSNCAGSWTISSASASM